MKACSAWCWLRVVWKVFLLKRETDQQWRCHMVLWSDFSAVINPVVVLIKWQQPTIIKIYDECIVCVGYTKNMAMVREVKMLN